MVSLSPMVCSPGSGHGGGNVVCSTKRAAARNGLGTGCSRSRGTGPNGRGSAEVGRDIVWRLVGGIPAFLTESAEVAVTDLVA